MHFSATLFFQPGKEEVHSTRSAATNHSTMTLLALAVAVAGSQIAASQQEKPVEADVSATKAVAVTRMHYAFDATAIHASADQTSPLASHWSVDKAPAENCDSTAAACRKVYFEIPSLSIRCSWVVKLSADGSDGEFLEENDDAAQYMRRTATDSEAKALVVTRVKPVIPAIATLMRPTGAVTMEVLVSESGIVKKIAVSGGPAALQKASADAANKWRFKPFRVGDRAIPFEAKLVFNFGVFKGPGSTLAWVDVAP